MSFDYNDPIITRRRKGNLTDDPFVPINDTLIVDSNGKAILTELPDSFSKIVVTGDAKTWYEIKSGLPSSNQFLVDYKGSKIVTFNISNAGKQLSFSYKGTGLHYVPTSMIYTKANGTVITETLKDLTDATTLARDTTNSLNTSVQSAETVRVGNENTRISSESQRSTNETNRGNSESTRVSQETSRVNAENNRVNSESSRITAENTRTSNETSRTTAETARVNAETARVSSETARTTSESTRVSQESTRVSAESTRATNESTRQSQEATRQTNTTNAINTTKINWLTPVATYVNIATNYPTPLNGDTVQVTNDTTNNGTYRFNGSSWIKIQNPNGYANTSDIYFKAMFPDVTYINLEGLTIGNFILTPTKVALGTVTLSI